MSTSQRSATLEPASTSVTMRSIRTSPTDNPGRSTPFERHLAKYRSLPLLWLRTCGSSDQQEKRRSTGANIDTNTIDTSLGHFGELSEDIYPSSGRFHCQNRSIKHFHSLVSNAHPCMY